MNQIEQEVQRYNAKKDKEASRYIAKRDKLTRTFVQRMTGIITGRKQAIQQTNEAIIELNNKRNEDQDVLKNAEQALDDVLRNA